MYCYFINIVKVLIKIPFYYLSTFQVFLNHLRPNFEVCVCVCDPKFHIPSQKWPKIWPCRYLGNNCKDLKMFKDQLMLKSTQHCKLFMIKFRKVCVCDPKFDLSSNSRKQLYLNFICDQIWKSLCMRLKIWAFVDFLETTVRIWEYLIANWCNSTEHSKSFITKFGKVCVGDPKFDRSSISRKQL